MILSITGGRRNPDGSILVPSHYQLRQFEILLAHLGATEVHDGNALGTDRFVHRLIATRIPDVDAVAWPVISADGPWPRAGHRRNRRMLVESKSQGLIAFPGGTGTENCIRTALSLGLRVWQWQGDREQGEFREITRKGESR